MNNREVMLNSYKSTGLAPLQWSTKLEDGFGVRKMFRGNLSQWVVGMWKTQPEKVVRELAFI